MLKAMMNGLRKYDFKNACLECTIYKYAVYLYAASIKEKPNKGKPE